MLSSALYSCDRVGTPNKTIDCMICWYCGDVADKAWEAWKQVEHPRTLAESIGVNILHKSGYNNHNPSDP